MTHKTIICLFILFIPFFVTAEDKKTEDISEKKEISDSKTDENKKRPITIRYEYRDRDHSVRENIFHLGVMFGASLVLYPATQPDTVFKKGSFSNYENNFGRMVFDKDEPFWNWIVHPYSGSQLFLYYRANGYSRIDSLAMTFISSTFFEFFIEVYTEPASVQDFYQTPVLGSFLGVGLETLSLYLLNTGNLFGKFFGHLINPSSMFNFFEHRVKMTSYIIPGNDTKAGLWMAYEF